VQEFLNKLNAQQKGRKWDYRLPTDAEWEYGCRGAASKGDSSWAFYIGKQGTNDLSSDDANFHGKFAAGNAKKGKYLGRPTMVGQYAANILGLYDMHGNVWQWCDDLGIGKVKRCMRGGAWNSEGEQCRAAFRTSQAPGDRFDSVGFRLARVPSK
jgi:formylglycine-generating enzyme required for sulfatase activity